MYSKQQSKEQNKQLRHIHLYALTCTTTSKASSGLSIDERTCPKKAARAECARSLAGS